MLTLEATVKPHQRFAFVPVTSAKTSTRTASKFSGVPALLENEEWPCCKTCSEPMQLFLQLNSDDLPAEANKIFGEGILQVFYCCNSENGDEEGTGICEVDCDAYFGFGESTLVRIIKKGATISMNEISSPVKNEYPVKVISSWVKKEDFPGWEELENLGCELTDEQMDLYIDEYGLDEDKYLGWPNWVQNIEYPECPKCHEPMGYVFQIVSNDNLPNGFGDSGTAHITQCKTCSDVLTIAWAC